MFDWDQLGTSDSLGTAKIDLSDLEPLEPREVVLPLRHPKYGQKGEIKLCFVFTPQIVARTRKSTSTFAVGQRAMTSVATLPFGATKTFAHGIGSVGGKAKGLFGGTRSKTIDESDEVTGFSIPVPQLPPKDNNGAPIGPAPTGPPTNPSMLEPPSGQISQPTGVTALAPNSLLPTTNTAAFSGQGSAPQEPGTLRVTVASAKDLGGQNTDIKPYVMVKIGKKDFSTKHHSKTTNPEWYVSLIITIIL